MSEIFARRRCRGCRAAGQRMLVDPPAVTLTGMKFWNGGWASGYNESKASRAEKPSDKHTLKDLQLSSTRDHTQW